MNNMLKNIIDELKYNNIESPFKIEMLKNIMDLSIISCAKNLHRQKFLVHELNELNLSPKEEHIKTSTIFVREGNKIIRVTINDSNIIR